MTAGTLDPTGVGKGLAVIRPLSSFISSADILDFQMALSLESENHAVRATWITGKLPMTWPLTLAQEPINVGDADYDPLYPFGYGLKAH